MGKIDKKLAERSALSFGSTGYHIYLDSDGKGNTGILVLRGDDRTAISQAAERLGQPVGSAKLVEGVVKFSSAKAGRCFMASAAAVGGVGTARPRPID